MNPYGVAPNPGDEQLLMLLIRNGSGNWTHVAVIVDGEPHIGKLYVDVSGNIVFREDE
jgi:hypothetical protein